MGWTYTDRDRSMPVGDWIVQKSGCFTWTNSHPWKYTVLDHAIVNMREFYAAVEQVNEETNERRVWAAMFLLDLASGRDGFSIGYKDMDESMGPNYYNCPKRILDLLTPTEYRYANEWRAKCRAVIAQRENARKALKTGVTIVLYGREYKVGESLGRKGWKIYPLNMTGVYRLAATQIKDITEIRGMDEPKPQEQAALI